MILRSDLDKNLLRLANFPFSFCTSFKHFGDGKLRTFYFRIPLLSAFPLYPRSAFFIIPKELSPFLMSKGGPPSLIIDVYCIWKRNSVIFAGFQWNVLLLLRKCDVSVMELLAFVSDDIINAYIGSNWWKISKRRPFWELTIRYFEDYCSDDEYTYQSGRYGFEKIKDIKVEDDPLACDSPLEVFNCEIRGDDEVELTDEEFSDNEDEIAEVFRIDTNIFDYETPICLAFNEFNYLLKTEPKPVIHTCKPFNYKTGCSEWPTCSWMNDGYCNGGNLPGTFIIENQLHYQDYEWYEALEDSELKDEALRNKAIMEGSIKDDDESSYEQMRRWDIYTNYDDTYKTNHDDNEREELCEVHEPPVCTIQRFEMIKYSFGQGEEYVAIKEDEYDDLARTSNNACRTYQEIFRMMDEGWMVTRAE
ncbi:hypothetical protein Tco_1359568 [Tanacetum coccineum]